MTLSLNKGFFRFCIVCILTVFAISLKAEQPFPIQAAIIQSNCVSFSFSTATGRLYLVESADEASGYWTQNTNVVGSGAAFSYTNIIGQQQQFSRIQSRPQTNLTLFSSSPLIESNVVALS